MTITSRRKLSLTRALPLIGDKPQPSKLTSPTVYGPAHKKKPSYQGGRPVNKDDIHYPELDLRGDPDVAAKLLATSPPPTRPESHGFLPPTPSFLQKRKQQRAVPPADTRWEVVDLEKGRLVPSISDEPRTQHSFTYGHSLPLRAATLPHRGPTRAGRPVEVPKPLPPVPSLASVIPYPTNPDYEEFLKRWQEEEETRQRGRQMPEPHTTLTRSVSDTRPSNSSASTYTPFIKRSLNTSLERRPQGEVRPPEARAAPAAAANPFRSTPAKLTDAKRLKKPEREHRGPPQAPGTYFRAPEDRVRKPKVTRESPEPKRPSYGTANRSMTSPAAPQTASREPSLERGVRRNASTGGSHGSAHQQRQPSNTPQVKPLLIVKKSSKQSLNGVSAAPPMQAKTTSTDSLSKSSHHHKTDPVTKSPPRRTPEPTTHSRRHDKEPTTKPSLHRAAEATVQPLPRRAAEATTLSSRPRAAEPTKPSLRVQSPEPASRPSVRPTVNTATTAPRSKRLAEPVKPSMLAKRPVSKALPERPPPSPMEVTVISPNMYSSPKPAKPRLPQYVPAMKATRGLAAEVKHKNNGTLRIGLNFTLIDPAAADARSQCAEVEMMSATETEVSFFKTPPTPKNELSMARRAFRGLLESPAEKEVREREDVRKRAREDATKNMRERKRVHTGARYL